MPLVVSEGVFDAWRWCDSDFVEVDWRPRSRFEDEPTIGAENPSGLVFVMSDTCTFLPRELARLHAPEFDFGDRWALAPYAIDDATDGLYAQRVRPRDVLSLAANSLRALVWGLHDWVHFHNHGPFDDPPRTELQCDLVALAWLRRNREAIGVPETAVERVAGDLAALSHARLTEAKIAFAGPEALTRLFVGDYPDARDVACVVESPRP